MIKWFLFNPDEQREPNEGSKLPRSHVTARQRTAHIVYPPSAVAERRLTLIITGSSSFPIKDSTFPRYIERHFQPLCQILK